MWSIFTLHIIRTTLGCSGSSFYYYYKSSAPAVAAARPVPPDGVHLAGRGRVPVHLGAAAGQRLHQVEGRPVHLVQVQLLLLLSWAVRCVLSHGQVRGEPAQQVLQLVLNISTSPTWGCPHRPAVAALPWCRSCRGDSSCHSRSQLHWPAACTPS